MNQRFGFLLQMQNFLFFMKVSTCIVLQSNNVRDQRDRTVVTVMWASAVDALRRCYRADGEICVCIEVGRAGSRQSVQRAELQPPP